MPKRQKGESKSSALHWPTIEPRPPGRRRRRAGLGQLIDALTAAERRVAESDSSRAREHEARVVLPRRNESRPQIDILLANGGINQVQHRAATEFLRLYQGSGYVQRLVADYDGNTRGPGAGLGAGPTSALFSKALEAAGIAFSGLLIAVVIQDWPPGLWAERRGAKATDGVANLRWVLDELAEHFGFKKGRP